MKLSETDVAKLRLPSKSKYAYIPQIGDLVGRSRILGVWTDSDESLKGYKVECYCSNVLEFRRADKVLGPADEILKGTRFDIRCSRCANVNSDKLEILHKYGWDRGKILHMRWGRCRGRNKLSREFKDSLAFADYISNLPGVYDLSLDIDRVDGRKGYERGNIRFVTRQDNCNNRRNTRFVTYESGESLPLTEFIKREFGYKFHRDNVNLYSFCANRWAQNWSADKIKDAVLNEYLN